MRNKHAESCKKGMYGIFRPGSKIQANFGYRSFTYSIYRYGLPECYQTMTYQAVHLYRCTACKLLK